MVGRTDGNGVDPRIFEQFTEIAIGLDCGGLFAGLLFFVVTLDKLLRMGDPLGIHIADCHDAGDIVFENAWQVHFVRDSPATDLTDVDFVARGVFAEDR